MKRVLKFGLQNGISMDYDKFLENADIESIDVFSVDSRDQFSLLDTTYVSIPIWFDKLHKQEVVEYELGDIEEFVDSTGAIIKQNVLEYIWDNYSEDVDENEEPTEKVTNKNVEKWIPKEGEGYWSVTFSHEYNKNCGFSIDHRNFNDGNVFKTEKEALEAVDKLSDLSIKSLIEKIK